MKYVSFVFSPSVYLCTHAQHGQVVKQWHLVVVSGGAAGRDEDDLCRPALPLFTFTIFHSFAASSASARSTGPRQQSSYHKQPTGSLQMFHYKTVLRVLKIKLKKSPFCVVSPKKTRLRSQQDIWKKSAKRQRSNQRGSLFIELTTSD